MIGAPDEKTYRGLLTWLEGRRERLGMSELDVQQCPETVRKKRLRITDDDDNVTRVTSND